MKALAIALPLLAMLAGCNSEPAVKAKNVSLAEAAEAARGAAELTPGKWQTAARIVSIDTVGVPDQVAKALRQGMAGPGMQTVDTCLTPEAAAKPPETMFAGEAKNCRYETFEMTAGRMTGTLVCKGPSGEIRSNTTGAFTSTSFDVTSASSMPMPATASTPRGSGTIKVKTQVTGKRLGPCDSVRKG